MLAGCDPQLERQLFMHTLQGAGLKSQAAWHWLLQSAVHRHHASEAVHWVTVPSQVMDCAGTLVHEITGVQLKVEKEQVVVHVVAASTEVPHCELAREATTSRAARSRTFRISVSFVNCF